MQVVIMNCTHHLGILPKEIGGFKSNFAIYILKWESYQKYDTIQPFEYI